MTVIWKKTPPFENLMSRTQTVLGWIYLALHMIVWPLLLRLYAEFSPNPVDAVKVNLIYYVLGIVFVLTVMLTYLRRSYDVLLDRFRLCLLSILLAFIIDYALSTAAALILLLAGPLAEELPNDASVTALAQMSLGVTKALTIFLAPIVEEVLFRGVVFGTLRHRSRGWAYVVSVALFSLFHVAGYVFDSGNFAQLIYIIPYIPVSVALVWAYERSGCIWTTIFFHMGFNAVSYSVMNLMESV